MARAAHENWDLSDLEQHLAAAGDVPWVSTNDCAVSAFLNCLRPDVALMAINFRGKLAGCDDDDAGAARRMEAPILRFAGSSAAFALRTADAASSSSRRRRTRRLWPPNSRRLAQ